MSDKEIKREKLISSIRKISAVISFIMAVFAFIYNTFINPSSEE